MTEENISTWTDEGLADYGVWCMENLHNPDISDSWRNSMADGIAEVDAELMRR